MTRFHRTPFSPLTLLLVSILAGCATTPPNPSTNVASKQSPHTAPQALASQPEDDPLLALLTAEIASQRGDYATATQAYVAAAKSQQDPELARRGVEVSLRQNLAEPAYQAALVWESLAPNNPLAKRTIMLLELGTDRIEQALPKLKTYLSEIRAQDQNTPNPNGWNADKTAIELLLRIPDRSKVYNLALELFDNKPQDVDNQVLLGETALYTEQYDLAIQHMQQALQLAPTEQNHLIMARFLEKRDKNPNSAIEHLDAQANEHPDWFNTRLYLARNHTQLEQWPQAKQRFQEMLRIKPAETSLHSSLGFVLSKLKARQAAEHHFKQYLKSTPSQDRQNETLIYLTMADLALAEKDYKSALKTLTRAPNSAKTLDIQLKKADIYEQLGQHKAATATLQRFQALDENSAVRLILAKAQQAETRKNQHGAVLILEQGLDRFPKQPDLLYERAMLAERQNDLTALEKHLTELIQIRPDNAHAYNALGYTWADRNIRLDEALTMITKASKLAPNDPFIMDSLGWVYYRTNQLEDAETTLKKAYAIRPDEEIGLHLLEVLQQRGKTEEANALGQSLKQKHPKSDKLNQLLQATTPISTGP